MKDLFEKNQLSNFLPFNNIFSGRNLKIEGGQRRYGFAASRKPRPGRISQENLMPGQKTAQKPDLASFHELLSVKIENVQPSSRSLFSLLSNHTFVKNFQNLMPGQNLPPKT